MSATAVSIPEGVLPDHTTGAEAGQLNLRLRDRFGRAITDLRVSVTDRCNYRCVYCRSGNDGAQFSELPIPDYLRMVRLLVSMGVEKVRLTGGEPLLRSGLVEMVQELASMRTAFGPDGLPTSSGAPLDLALTTNGHLLADLAAPLKAAGVTVIVSSLDFFQDGERDEQTDSRSRSKSWQLESLSPSDRSRWMQAVNRSL